MLINKYFSILAIILIFTACNNTEEIVASKYPNGTTQLIEHYKKIGENSELVKTTRFYPNGQKEIVTEFKNGKRNGLQTVWYATGNVWTEENFKDDIKHGEFTVYYNSGIKNYAGEYYYGKPHGKWTFYDETGAFLSEKNY
jgi:antitoxin component YwqK of YwqJK toxin-antitoxin module